MIFFGRKIVVFHMKYPKIFRASLRSTQFFLLRPPNLKSWIRPWILPFMSQFVLTTEELLYSKSA